MRLIRLNWYFNTQTLASIQPQIFAKNRKAINLCQFGNCADRIENSFISNVNLIKHKYQISNFVI